LATWALDVRPWALGFIPRRRLSARREPAPDCCRLPTDNRHLTTGSSSLLSVHKTSIMRAGWLICGGLMAFAGRRAVVRFGERLSVVDVVASW